MKLQRYSKTELIDLQKCFSNFYNEFKNLAFYEEFKTAKNFTQSSSGKARDQNLLYTVVRSLSVSFFIEKEPHSSQE
jgi:hypothetical protein